jgi:hypothetical protein
MKEQNSALLQELASWGHIVVGLCTLNSFDPYPIAYSLSNP